MSTSGGASHHKKKSKTSNLSTKTVPELRAMAKRVGAKQTRSDGTHKNKSQLVASIRRANHGHHGGASGGASGGARKKKRSSPRY